MSAPHVVAVLPQGSYPLAKTPGLRRWLSRGEVTARAADRELLLDVLAAAGLAPPDAGLAALRYAGQVGVAPDGWIAAADPAHLETRLRHLVLRPFPAGEVAPGELAAIFASLNAVFADDGFNFEQADGNGYLRTASPVSTAECSADCAAGRLPDEFMPAGDAAATFHRLQSEIQMLLHEHPVNQQRRQSGKPAINTLWLWGGGKLIAGESGALPLLISNDSLFTGYWASRGQSCTPWRRDSGAIAEAPGRDVVITVPGGPGADESGALQELLSRLRTMLKAGQAGKLTLFFGSDIVVRIGRRDGMKFWRGVSPLLAESRDDG